MITELKPKQYFVFGSNLLGSHVGGAARTAIEKFGAIEGQAKGLQGQSYAIPTIDENWQPLPLTEIKKYVDELIEDATIMNSYTFFVTAIGTGIAGYTYEDIAPMFKHVPFNIVLPKEWQEINV